MVQFGYTCFVVSSCISFSFLGADFSFAGEQKAVYKRDEYSEYSQVIIS
jgi:hypothetical protein